jgi:hypothetical protein
MQCVAPPELSDGQLLAYLDGEVGSNVAAHLTLCPSCRGRAGQLARLLGRMTLSLYRFDCPEPAELGEYHLGLVPTARAVELAEHLVHCPHCRTETAQLQDFLVDTARDLEPSIVERVRILVARLLTGGSTAGPTLTPALAGFRGGYDAPLVFEAGDIQITLTAEPSEKAPDRHTLFGLVIGLESPEAQVQLWQAGRLADETTIDAAGNFVLDEMATGRYELVILGPGVEIHLQDVQV